MALCSSCFFIVHSDIYKMRFTSYRNTHLMEWTYREGGTVGILKWDLGLRDANLFLVPILQLASSMTSAS